MSKPVVICCVVGCGNRFTSQRRELCPTCYGTLPDPLKHKLSLTARAANRGEPLAVAAYKQQLTRAKTIARAALLRRYPSDEPGNLAGYEAAP